MTNSNQQSINSELLLKSEYVRMHDLATTAGRSEKIHIDSFGIQRVIKAKAPKVGILPMGQSTIWRKIQLGEFPRPIKISPRISAFKTKDILHWLESKEQEFSA